MIIEVCNHAQEKFLFPLSTTYGVFLQDLKHGKANASQSTSEPSRQGNDNKPSEENVEQVVKTTEAELSKVRKNMEDKRYRESFSLYHKVLKVECFSVHIKVY